MTASVPKISVSVVVPVYNSEGSLPVLISALEPVLSSNCSAYEVILVDDGSRDSSATVIDSLSREKPWVRGISLMRNYGQHNALLCGIRSARFKVIITMDDDLQNPPDEIPRLLTKLAEGYDVVYGTPEYEQHGLFRNLASQITKLTLQNALGAETARRVSAFRAFRTEVRNAFDTYRSPFVSIDVLLTWGTSRFAALPVRHEPRRIGSSQYTLGKLLVHTANMMTGFSTLPLQVASLVGFVFTLFGFGVLVFVLGSYVIRGASVTGFPFLASIIALFSGAQLFALGIVGEYVARIHFRTMERPTYVPRPSADTGPGR